MKAMKKRILAIALTLLGITVYGQDDQEVRIKEVGLTFYNLDGFGITYRIGKQNAVWRFNTGFASGGRTYIGDNTNSSFQIGASAGREWRKELTEKLDFRYGFDVQYNYSKRTNEGNFNGFPLENIFYTSSGGVGAVIGFNYEISSSLFIGAEILPFVNFNYNQNNTVSVINDPFGNTYLQEFVDYNYSESFGIQNNSALISLIYRY
jgi:hypothetical protein